MAEHHHPQGDEQGDPHREVSGSAVGSVAEETARLLEALLGSTPAAAAGAAPRAAGRTAPVCPTCGAPDTGSTTSVTGQSEAAAAQEPPPTSSGTGGTCTLCPVCQLLQVARAVRPETVDRLSELVGALAETLTDLLHDVSASRRTGPAQGRAAGGAGPSSASAGSEVEDIVVGTDDLLEDAEGDFDEVVHADPSDPSSPTGPTPATSASLPTSTKESRR